MPTDAEVDALYQQVVAVMDGQPGDLQGHVISNMIAAFALANMTAGYEPYSIARKIYQNSRIGIRDNLAAQNISTRKPRGLN